ncbi:MAG TPA: methenyltetrahydrofolate cyclohydrolase [Crenotrichaceae bacterium]|nr:methenyltetrahydrofolate cyclohydrolase [Crenotrichaceae bacterium]
MEITQLSIDEFIHDLASKTPTPGGGSAAAVIAAMAAALVSMVANLTIGKKDYAFVETQMQELLTQSTSLRQELLDLIHADIEAFNQVMAAYKQPKTTDDGDNKKRSEAIQSALKTATDVPLQCAEACRSVMRLSKIAAEIGNKNVVSDAGVAVLAAQAALRSSALNVYINIGYISDKDFTKSREDKLDLLLDGADAETEEIYQLVKNKL